MNSKDYIQVDGDNNLVLQDISGCQITVNKLSSIEKIFKNTTTQYLIELSNQLNKIYKFLQNQNVKYLENFTKRLYNQLEKQNIKYKQIKNLSEGSISNINGNVHIGDIIYNSIPKNENINSNISLLDIKPLLLNNNKVIEALDYLRKSFPNDNTLIIFYSEYNQLINDIQIGIKSYSNPEWKNLINRILMYIDEKNR